MSARRALVLALGLGSPLSCSPEALVAKEPMTPEFKAFGADTCKASGHEARPYVIEWPSTDRALLEASAHHGVVVVRASPCQIEVLRCHAPGAYSYTPLSPKTEQLRIRNSDDLFAKLPVGAARLAGKLQMSGSLDADLMVVGELAADRPDVHRDELVGDCGTATHVIVGMTVGAFEFATSGSRSAGAEVEVAGVGAGGDTSQSREVLARDGDKGACRSAGGSDTAPPSACGGTLRIEVASIREPRPPVPVPVAAGVTGAVASASPPPPGVSCPPDSVWNGSDCALPAPLPVAGRFVVTQATVIDSASGLMWQRRHPMTRVSWRDADRYCRSLPIAGGGWRLPSGVELTVIAGHDDAFAAQGGQGGQDGADEGFFWSSTPSSVDPMRATMVRTRDGFSRLYFMDYEESVRCVRGSTGAGAGGAAAAQQ